MSHLTRLESLQAMRAEVETERDDLREQLNRLTQEADMLDGLLEHYAQIADVSGRMSIVTPEHRAGNGRPQSSSKPGTTTSIRNEILELLREVRKPLHYRLEMLPLLLQRGVQIASKNPASSLSAHLSEDARFVKQEGHPGYWTLAPWVFDRGNTSKSAEMPESASQEPSAREEQVEEPPIAEGQSAFIVREGDHSPYVIIPNAHLLKRRHEGSAMTA